MSSFACYWPWLFGGLLGGWLLWQLFDRLFRRDGETAGLRARRELESANARCATLQTEAAAATAKIAALRAELDAAKKSLKVQSDDVARLTDEVTRGTSRVSDLETSMAAAAAVAAELASVKDAHGTVAAELATVKDAHGTATAELARIRDSHASVAAELVREHEAHGTDKAELVDLRGTVARLHASLDSASVQYATIDADLREARAGLAAREQEATRIAAELAECRSRNVSLADELTRATAAATSVSALAGAAEFGYRARRDGRDDLLIIEGIGPKINGLLTNAGIDTFAKLAAAPVSQVQAVLDAAGPKFRLANPASWTRQAAMCAAGQWKELRAYQDTLSAGVARGDAPIDDAAMLAAAAAHGFVPRRAGKDDLVIIEGIGPKINELLLANGIDTFRTLAKAPIAVVQKILDTAGPNYRLANPGSWAAQAALCSAGDWPALRAMQDSLRGGVDAGHEGADT